MNRKKRIKIILVPFTIFAVFIGLIRFLCVLTWGISTEFKNDIFLYLVDKPKQRNGIAKADWIPIDGKWHHIATTLVWLPDGNISSKTYLDGELVSENGVPINQNKEDV